MGYMDQRLVQFPAEMKENLQGEPAAAVAAAGSGRD
jgi:hypothetical protein